MPLRWAAGSDVGKHRTRNEDSAYAGEHLLAVADGLGGHVAGDIASATALQALAAFDHKTPRQELGQELGRAVAAANDAIRRAISTDRALAGMGTTLVALLHTGDHAVLANVGDSRAYLVRDRNMRRLTEDHQYGHLVGDASRIPDLPERLTRFLDGRIDGRSPDITSHQLQVDDRLLLCSDGLTNAISDVAIAHALNHTLEPEHSVGKLIQLALDAGGPDNITVIVADVIAGKTITRSPVLLGALAGQLR